MSIPNIGGPSNFDSQPIRSTGEQVGGKGADGNFHIFSTDNTGALIVNTGGGGGTTTVQTALNSARTTPAAITFASSGNNTVIAAIGGKVIRVFRMALVVAGATNITFEDSTPTLFTGAMPFQANGSLVLDFTDEPWFTTAVGAAFVINSSNAVQVSGVVYFTQS
jgi:hypothetical protein